MKQRIYRYTTWTALFLFAGSTVSTAAERVTADVLAVARTRPSVGNIHTEKAAPDSGKTVYKSDNGRKINGMGTGIVIDERGYLVTNYHVIADVDTIRVDIEDENRLKSSYIARRIASDKEHDLAIIKIDSHSPSRTFKVMPSGTSSDLMLCEKVIAIGNAFGYDGTVTTGIISALGRDVEANETVSYKNLIQTDAAINPGNSGGPLINVDGEVIGINVAIRANSQKIGFAIPIDDARKAIARMMSIENLDRNFHGLITKDLKDGPVRMLVVDSSHTNSPAAICGLRQGDVITRAGSHDVIDGVDLERAFLHRRAGDSIELVFKRADKLERTTLALAPYTGGRSVVTQETQITARANNDDLDRFWNSLGLRLTSISTTEQKSLREKTKYRGGMRVQEVKADSSAAASGFQKGDILVGLGEWETTRVDDITWIMNRLGGQVTSTESAQQVKFFIFRSNVTQFGFIPLHTAPQTAAAN